MWERGCRCGRVCACAADAPAGRGVQRGAGPAGGRRIRMRLRRASAARRATTTSRLDQLFCVELRGLFVGPRLAELLIERVHRSDKLLENSRFHGNWRKNKF